MFLDRIPVRLRLSLGHSIWMALLFLGVGTGLYRLVEHNLYQSVDAALMASAKSIRDDRFVRGFSPLMMERFLHQFFSEKYINPYAQLVDLSGKISAKTNVKVNLPVTPRALSRAEKGLVTIETFKPKNADNEISHLRQVTVPVIKFGRFTGELIQVAAPLDTVSHTLGQIFWVLMIALPAGLLFSILFGYLLTRRAFKPVKDISQAAGKLGSDDLSVRLPLPVAHDELRNLALTFNEMLDRLDDAFKRLRRFTGDVSHELRTPLAVLRGEAELALRRERTPEEYRTAMRQIVHESKNMTGIIEDLLLLARAESRSVAMSWMDATLKDFVADLTSVVQPIYDKHGVTLQVINHGDEVISAHPSYLSLALRNILINAAKHSAKDGVVEFKIDRDGPDWVFSITDFGEGIPTDSVPYIFDPFYRADTARNRAAGGAGIGLSLAMALVKLHHGNITVRSTQGQGATFIVRIPPEQVVESTAKEEKFGGHPMTLPPTLEVQTP